MGYVEGGYLVKIAVSVFLNSYTENCINNISRPSLCSDSSYK